VPPSGRDAKGMKPLSHFDMHSLGTFGFRIYSYEIRPSEERNNFYMLAGVRVSGHSAETQPQLHANAPAPES